MNVNEMKAAACAAIDANADKIIALGESIFEEPELGYKEFKTAAKVQAALDELGLQHQDGVAVTGILTPLKGRDHKAHLAIMGELDAVVAAGHRCADPVTGAAHACGHFAQAASVVGAAYGLTAPGVMENLDGDITLMHVPAEEFVELAYRKSLIEQGTVKLLGGKQEFIRLGVFDDVDMMIMQHTRTTENEDSPAEIKADAGGTGMGFVGKMIQYIGKASHAAAPHMGINALKAAQLGLAGIDANRETFQDKDSIRVHPIITKGGDLVNVVPDDVRIETYVRGLSVDAVLDASAKVDRALQAGAMAVGAQVEIVEIPGYMPRRNDPAFKQGEEWGREWGQRVKDYAEEDLAPAAKEMAAEAKVAASAAGKGVMAVASTGADAAAKGFRAIVGDDTADKAESFVDEKLAPAGRGAAKLGLKALDAMKPLASKAAKKGSELAAAAGEKLAESAKDMLK